MKRKRPLPRAMTSDLLSDDLQKAVKEALRGIQTAPPPPHELAERLCRLFRVTAIKMRDAHGATKRVRDQLQPFVEETCILESLYARVLETLNGENANQESVEMELQALLDEVRESQAELAEQASGIINEGDCLMVLGEGEGGVIEMAIREAAEAVVEEGGRGIEVVVVRVAPDHKDLAGGMKGRLEVVKGVGVRVVDDVEVTRGLKGCDKVLLSGVGVEADDGGACGRGAALVCAAAARMSKAVVLVVGRHRILPVGCRAVVAMSQREGYPGMVWNYEEARDDRVCEAIAVVGGVYDVVSLQKCELVVTEFGGYASDFVKFLVPNVKSGHADVEH